MDPWLELYWQDVHASLIIYIRDAVQDQLPPGLIARAEQNVTLDLGGEQRWFRPDVRVAQQVMELKDGPACGGNALQTTEPVVIEFEEPEPHRYVEIIDGKSGGKIVTVIEVLSPKNKELSHGESLYLSKRQSCINARVNVLEINLLRGGADVCMVPLRMLSDAQRTVYRACVFRAARPWRREVYPMPLRQPLPVISVPLRASDTDALLNLQELMEKVYRQGRYDTLDYAAPLESPLSEEDSAWAADLVRACGLMP